MDCELDCTFPNYNPEPRRHWRCCTPWPRRRARAWRRPGARLRRRRRPLRRGGRRGRGDLRRQDRPDAGPRPRRRCIQDATFVVDVKSTGLFATDPVLQGERRQDRLLEDRPQLHQAQDRRDSARWPGSRSPATSSSTRRSAAATTTGWWRRAPILAMLDRNPGKKLAELKRPCPSTCTSLTMSPHCADEVKYGVVDEMVAEYEQRRRRWRQARRPEDPRADHRQRRAGRAGGRLLGAGARLLQQARARRGGRKPDLGSEHARDLRRDRSRGSPSSPRSRRLQPEDLGRPREP